MKRLFVMIAIIFALLTVALPTIYAVAEDVGEAEQTIDELVTEQINVLDLDELQRFADSLAETPIGSFSVADYIRGITRGEIALEPQELNKLLLNVLCGQLLSMLPIFILPIAIGILQSLLNGISAPLTAGGTSGITNFVCGMAIVCILLSAVTGVIVDTVDMLDDIYRITMLIFPVMLTLMVATGEVVTAGVFQPIIGVFGGIMLNLIRNILLPLVIATVIFSVVGRLSGSLKLSKLTRVARSVTEYVLGASLGLFSAFLAVRGVIGGSVDGVTLRTARFLMSGYLPVVGGYISEGLDLVSLSLTLVRSGLGATAMLMLLAVIILPVVRLSALSLGLKLSAVVAEPLGNTQLSDMLYDLSKSVTLMLLVVLAAAFMTFVLLIFLMLSVNAFV